MNKLNEVRVPREERIELYRDNNVIVVVPLTHKALKKYANSCLWCINHDRVEWEEYHKGLHAIIIQRKPKDLEVGVTGNPTASEIFVLSKWDNGNSSLSDVEEMLFYEFPNEKETELYYLDITSKIKYFGTNIVYYSPENGTYDMEDNFLSDFNYSITDVPNVTSEIVQIIDNHFKSGKNLQETIRRIIKQEIKN
jgi:hypothetical protein